MANQNSFQVLPPKLQKPKDIMSKHGSPQEKLPATAEPGVAEGKSPTEADALARGGLRV